VPEFVTYVGKLPYGPATVEYLGDLLRRHWEQTGARCGRRVLGWWDQVVMWLRSMHDNTRVVDLARDNGIGRSTAYRLLDETTEVVAAAAPALASALLAAKIAGHEHVLVDGTVVRTDRIGEPGPTKGVDLWWSGKHRAHGGNIQVIAAPDGHPIWCSEVRPGREHDITCARAIGLPEALDEMWNCEADTCCPVRRSTLADLGYEAEAAFTTPTKKPRAQSLTADQRWNNRLVACLRAPGERANALLKNFKALRRVTRHPSKITALARAALVLVHHLTDRQV